MVFVRWVGLGDPTGRGLGRDIGLDGVGAVPPGRCWVGVLGTLPDRGVDAFGVLLGRCAGAVRGAVAGAVRGAVSVGVMV